MWLCVTFFACGICLVHIYVNQEARNKYYHEEYSPLLSAGLTPHQTHGSARKCRTSWLRLCICHVYLWCSSVSNIAHTSHFWDATSVPSCCPRTCCSNAVALRWRIDNSTPALLIATADLKTTPDAPVLMRHFNAQRKSLQLNATPSTLLTKKIICSAPELQFIRTPIVSPAANLIP